MSPVITLSPFQHALLSRLASCIQAHQTPMQAFSSLLLIMLVLETLDVDPAAIETIFGTETAKVLYQMIDAGARNTFERLAQGSEGTDEESIDFGAIVRNWAQEQHHAVLR
jgi:hypothetical protein